MSDAGGALEAELRRRFRVEEAEVTVGGRTLGILHPANAEELISDEDFERDERLPYWADLWPSAHVLARRVAHMSGAGRRLLELGCGSGLVTVAAALAGFEVTASDYYEDALRFTKANARRNLGVSVETRHVDWRALPGDLGPFDVVVASDVLYESEYGELVAAAFAATLAREPREFGRRRAPHRPVGIVTDPGRLAAGAFVDACAARGLAARTVERVRYEMGQIRQTIDVYEITR